MSVGGEHDALRHPRMRERVDVRHRRPRLHHADLVHPARQGVVPHHVRRHDHDARDHRLDDDLVLLRFRLCLHADLGLGQS